MKKLIFITALLTLNPAFASIEYEGRSERPSEAEIQKNRSCFRDLELLGCTGPGEDPQQFRSCMSDSFESLKKECQDLMRKLYF
jgi:hypothetical protein